MKPNIADTTMLQWANIAHYRDHSRSLLTYWEYDSRSDMYHTRAVGSKVNLPDKIDSVKFQVYQAKDMLRATREVAREGGYSLKEFADLESKASEHISALMRNAGIVLWADSRIQGVYNRIFEDMVVAAQAEWLAINTITRGAQDSFNASDAPQFSSVPE